MEIGTASSNSSAKKIKAAFILSNGQLVELSSLFSPFKKDASSNEIKDKGSVSGPEQVKTIDPPFDLAQLAVLYEKSVPHFLAVKAKAEDSVGLGWTIVPKGDGAGNDRMQSEATSFLENLNHDDGFDAILMNAITDYESLGMGYVEIARDLKTMLIGLVNHIQGTTIRIAKDLPLYCHKRGNRKVYFKRYGDKNNYDKNTGELNPANPEDRANELYVFKKYHPKSDYYGVPDIVPALSAILGDIFAREYNLDFFANGAIPSYAVVITGADVSPELKMAIEHYFKHDLKGTGNTQKTIVLPVPYENVKVEFKALNVDVKEGSFKLYRADNAQEILSAHGVPPARAMNFKQGALGGDISREADKIYRETVVAKNRRMAERFVNRMLAESGFADWALKFNRSRFSDIGAIGNFVTSGANSKVFTINELREIASPLFENGLDPIDGGDDLMEEAAAPDPFGFGGPRVPPDRPPDEPPEPQKGWKRNDDFSRLSKKRVDYDDLDVDTIQKFNAEYEGAKGTVEVVAKRRKNESVRETEDALISVFNAALKSVYKELRSQGGKSILGVQYRKEQPIKINKILLAIEKFTDDFQRVLEDGYSKSLIAGAKFSASLLKARQDVKAQGGPVGFGEMEPSDFEETPQVSFRLENPAVKMWIAKQSDAISKNISKNLSNRIRRQLQKGIENGETNDQIAKRLEDTVGVPDLRDSAGRLITAEARSAMIARTEVGDAFNVGSLMGFKDSGVVESVEVLDGDEWDDPCANANGQTWTFRRAENNSLEHPNCTRVFVPIVKDEPF